MKEFDLSKDGFRGFKTIAELREDVSLIPQEKGVYVVIYAKKGKPTFLQRGTGGFFKGKDPNVSLEELEEKWIDDEPIVYIGKAGGAGVQATLYSRLVQYLKFGQGRNVGHWGGRYIWQLADAKDLIICWKETTEEPLEVESRMIADFKKAHDGKRPFANKRD